MKDETLGERLRRARKRRGYTLLQIADRLGKSEATAQRYEAGKIRVDNETVYELAKAYGVSPAYLMGWETEEKAASEYPFIPAYVAAGLPQLVDAVNRSDIQFVSVPDMFMGKHAGSKEIYFISIDGESMNRVLPNGSLAAVKKVERDKIQDGDIVVYSWGGEFSVKRFYNVNGKLIFKPDSDDPSFTDQVFAEQKSDIVIHGKVVVSTRFFD